MDNLIRYLILTNLYLIGFYAAYRLLLARETRFFLNRLVLNAGLLMILLLPLIRVDLGVFTRSPVLEIPVLLTDVSEISAGETTDMILAAGHEKADFPVKSAVVLFFGIGASLMLLRFLWSISRICYWRIVMPRECIRSLRITLIPEKQQPFTFLRRIYIPSDHFSDTDALALILRHEEVHVRHYHSADMLFMAMVRVVFFYNPFVLFLKRELELNHEYTADRISSSDNRYLYSISLLSSQFKVPRLQLVHSFNQHSLLKRRFIMLSKNKHSRLSLVKYAALLPLIGGFLILSSFSVIGQEKKVDYKGMTKEQVALKAIEQEFTKAGFSQEDIFVFQKKILDKSNQDLMVDARMVKPRSAEEDAEVFFIVEEMPTFQGGNLEDFRNWVQKNVKYPDIAKVNGISGTVYANFTIDKAGKIENINIVRGVDRSLDDAVINVLKSAPAWVPGKQRGQNVKVAMAIPIKFMLDKDAKKDTDKDKSADVNKDKNQK